MEGENGLFAPQYGLILCLLPLVSSAYTIIVCFNQCFPKEHGKNFDLMAANFTVLAEAEASAAEDQNDARMEIAKLAKDFAEAYFNRNTEALSHYLADDYAWDRKEVYPGEDEVTDILIKQITGSENVDVGEKHTVSVEFRGMDQPDRFQYLTIELIKQVDGWKVAFYGLEG